MRYQILKGKKLSSEFCVPSSPFVQQPYYMRVIVCLLNLSSSIRSTELGLGITYVLGHARSRYKWASEMGYRLQHVLTQIFFDRTLWLSVISLVLCVCPSDQNCPNF